MSGMGTFGELPFRLPCLHTRIAGWICSVAHGYSVSAPILLWLRSIVLERFWALYWRPSFGHMRAYYASVLWQFPLPISYMARLLYVTSLHRRTQSQVFHFPSICYQQVQHVGLPVTLHTLRDYCACGGVTEDTPSRINPNPNAAAYLPSNANYIIPD